MENCSIHGQNWLRKDMIVKGGFGSVFLATRKNPKGLADRLAVKSAEFGVSKSLWKEHKILGKLQTCPHVIKCFGNELTMDENGKKVYNILLEYASGGSLLNRLRMWPGGKLPEPEVKRHARSILLGIKSVHEIGYAHLDIKPDNILLVRESGAEFKAKLCDFGSAKRLGKGPSRKGLRGTAMYLSPEAIVDSVQEGPADIWATGCVVLELLTGNSVWNRRSYWNTEKFIDMIGNEFKVPKIPSGLSKEAKEFLKGCFVRNPEDRLSVEMLLKLPFVSSAGVDDEQDKVLVCDYVKDKENIDSIKEERSVCNYIDDEEEEPYEIDGYLNDEDEEKPYQIVCDRKYEEEEDPSEEEEPYETVCDKEYEEEDDPSEDEEEPYEVVSDKENEEEDPSEDEEEPYEVVTGKEHEEEDPSEDEEEPYEVVSGKEHEEEDPSEDEEDPSEDEEEPYEVVGDKKYKEDEEPSEDINEEEEDPSEDEEEPHQVVSKKEYEEEPSVNNYDYKNEHARVVDIDEAESYETDPKYCYSYSEDDGNEEVQSSKRRKLS